MGKSIDEEKKNSRFFVFVFSFFSVESSGRSAFAELSSCERGTGAPELLVGAEGEERRRNAARKRV